LRVFLIDRDGNIRNIYSSGTLDVRLVLADIKTLLAEQP
jgi:protein SCO1/2